MGIKLTKHDEGTDDVYSIMQRVLLRDNQIDHQSSPQNPISASAVLNLWTS